MEAVRCITKRIQLALLIVVVMPLVIQGMAHAEEESLVEEREWVTKNKAPECLSATSVDGKIVFENRCQMTLEAGMCLTPPTQEAVYASPGKLTD